jgi:pSer/pThr/pTyr-binding forkhead associated (FHA) protein
VKICDIGISRMHAKLVIEKNEVKLYDLQSKFGTLRLIETIQMLKVEIPRSFQTGRTLIEVTLKRLS